MTSKKYKDLSIFGGMKHCGASEEVRELKRVSLRFGR